VTVKWGVIGAGGIADRRTIPGMLESDKVELIAVMDIDEARVKRVAEKYDVSAAYTKEEDLIADPNVEAVYIATPVYLHKKQALMAAEAEKHILLEKPMALNVSEAEEIAEAVEKAGVKFTQGYMMRFQELHKRAKEMIDEGILGEAVFARAQLSCWYPDIEGAWRQDPAKGAGGSLVDLASHCYDLLWWFMGDISEVFAFCDTLTFSYPVEDSSTTLLRFKSGAHAVVDAFFNVPDAAGQSRLEIYGNKGSIQAKHTIGQAAGGEMEAYISEAARQYDPQQEKAALEVERQEITAEPYNMYRAQVEYLSRCIEEDREPEINTHASGVYIMRIIEAAYESARSAKAVAI